MKVNTTLMFLNEIIKAKESGEAFADLSTAQLEQAVIFCADNSQKFCAPCPLSDATGHCTAQKYWRNVINRLL